MLSITIGIVSVCFAILAVSYSIHQFRTQSKSDARALRSELNEIRKAVKARGE